VAIARTISAIRGAGVAASLIATAKINGVEPFA